MVGSAPFSRYLYKRANREPRGFTSPSSLTATLSRIHSSLTFITIQGAVETHHSTRFAGSNLAGPSSCGEPTRIWTRLRPGGGVFCLVDTFVRAMASLCTVSVVLPLIGPVMVS